jgi:MATE family multidrug resistance protein
MPAIAGRSNAFVQARRRLRQFTQDRAARAAGEQGLRQDVLRLALPAMGEQMLSLMVSLVDTMLVGHLGAEALAGVSLSTQWVFMASTLFSAISTGSVALVARAAGAKDMGTANRTARQSVIVGLAVGLLATALAVLLAKPAVALMGAEPESLQQGTIYMRIAGMAFGLQAVMFICNACLRGVGDTRTTLKVMLVVNVVNIVVAWTAINGPFGLPRLGVAGSALGAATGRTVGGLLALGILLKGRSGLKLDLRGWRPDLETIRRLLRVGLPTGGEQLIMRVGMMSFVRVVASMGTVAVAAHAVALRAESISFMPGMGFAIAATTLVGQALGAKDPKRAERSGYLTCQVAAVLMTAMGLIFILLPRALISLFTTDEAVIAAAIAPLRIIGFFEPLRAAAMVFAGSLRGAGDTRFPMYVTGPVILAVRVPMALLLGIALGMGLAGAWLGMAADLCVRGIAFYLRFRSGRWKAAQV